jgi:hypothetical protein
MMIVTHLLPLSPKVTSTVRDVKPWSMSRSAPVAFSNGEVKAANANNTRNLADAAVEHDGRHPVRGRACHLLQSKLPCCVQATLEWCAPQ